MFNPLDTLPYIGLRPFSEDDSLYFKGRDEQILQLTALLEANKFLMVTGASGDGKSSLVYAGLVPNARAGFFNARYTNWVVADFRPERTPLYNLSKTISKNLRIGNEESVEVELRRGFSSLLELYTTSSLYVDETGEAWRSAQEEERDEMQRKAANLLIVADQFEEFFTNPENYYKNSPSADSQLVINLLLETARISIANNLPVYIVCTMRSDYIGQCATFRGLPEFIGFSQFFVPRLKRKEMGQVVKEPAELHGDRITNRLVERVVYDLGEGIDQLPVLEHAMNEVWIQAKNGAEELDLLHYAMAGGMPPNELPAEDRKKFDSWFNTLPAKLQEAYQRPGLSHIIDTHANKLYLSAADQYNESHYRKISSADAQLIIKVAFTCLTKMDEGRAVRNRMTLQEITDILARPELTTEVVGGVLNIFREQGNTFLRPYITDDSESRTLSPESVLDITHESLIRNWELLLTWAKEEYDHLTVYEDFKKQLDRWIASKKSKGFLLPIGPLTFFEDWHNKLNPSKYWINRYLDPGLSSATRLEEADQIVNNVADFLKRSGDRHRVTRFVVKYGAAKIGGILGSIFIITLCSFYYLDARKKENARIIDRVLEESVLLVKDNRCQSFYRAINVIFSEFLKPGSFKRILDQLPFEDKLTVIRGLYLEFPHNAGTADPYLKKECLYYLDSAIQSKTFDVNDPALMSKLKGLNLLVLDASHYLYFKRDEKLKVILDKSLNDTRQIIIASLTNNFEPAQLDFTAIDDGLENLLNFQVVDQKEIQLILNAISPFDTEKGKLNFSRYFPREKSILYSLNENITNNGGFQQLAYLYAMVGKTEKVKLCINNLFDTNKGYETFQNNVYNIAAYLAQYNHYRELEELVAWYCLKQKLSVPEFYETLLNRCGIISLNFSSKLFDGSNNNNNLDLLPGSVVQTLFSLYHASLLKAFSDKPDELNFRMSLFYKHFGSLEVKMEHDGKAITKNNFIDSLYEKSIQHYKKVSKTFLEQDINIYQRNNQKRLKRKDLFLYPDHLPKVFNNRSAPPLYYSSRFFHFLLDKIYFNDLFRETEDFKKINEWVLGYNEFNFPDNGTMMFKNYTPLDEKDLVRLDSILTHNRLSHPLNNNLPRLLLIGHYISKKETEKIDPIFQKLDIEKFNESLRLGDLWSTPLATNTRIVNVIEYLSSLGRKDEVIKIIRNYTKPSNRIKAYANAVQPILNGESEHQEDVYIYLDSAISETKRMRNFQIPTTDPRITLVLNLSSVGGKDMYNAALDYVRQLPIQNQADVMERWIQGIAASGNYYQAYSSIPELTILGDRLYHYNLILMAEINKRPMDTEWKKYFDKRQINYVWEDYRFEADLF